MQFRALIGTVVSNGKATVKFEELVYSTEHKDEIEMLKKAEGVTTYGKVALVEEPKVKKTTVEEKTIDATDLVGQYETLSGKVVSPRYSKDEVWLKAKIAELTK